MAAPKRLSPAQIINRLRKAEVALANGNTTKEVCRDLGVSEQTYYRWEAGVRGNEAEPGEASQGAREGEPTAEAGGGRADAGQADLEGSLRGKLLSPERRRRCVVQVRQRLGVSERRACRVLGQARSTQRRIPKRREDEEALREDVVKVARRFGRYGYRMVTGMLRTEGWAVNHKRVERIWRQEGLKVPERQPKRGRLWLNNGSCIRLRPLYRGHVWSYDFVASRTHDGRSSIRCRSSVTEVVNRVSDALAGRTEGAGAPPAHDESVTQARTQHTRRWAAGAACHGLAKAIRAGQIIPSPS